MTADKRNADLSDRAQLEKAYKLFQADMAGAFGAQIVAGRSEAGVAWRIDFAARDWCAETDPMAYEKAVASLSPEEANAYYR